MKKKLLIILPLFAVIAISATIDLSNLPRYSSQVIPFYIIKDNTPANNLLEDKGATLGRVLFYDRKLSVNNTTSCASCHHQQFAFGDTASASHGALGNTARHAIRLINVRFADEVRFFWDERAVSLEQQTTMPIQDHNEMGYSGVGGDPSINDLITKMNGIWYYPQLFTLAYGDPIITEQRMRQALSKFVRSIQSFDSKFDLGRAQVGGDGAPFPNFTSQENQGKQLFLTPAQFDTSGNRISGGAGCAGCHRAPEFDIAVNSRNNGVTGSFSGTPDFGVTRSPSLRDVVNGSGISYGGFMHSADVNGMITLLDVINHYDSIPADNINLDNRLKPGGKLQRLHLTGLEKNALVAFIRTLTGRDVYVNPVWSNPFTNDSLTIINAPNSIKSLAIDARVKVYPTLVIDKVNVVVPAVMYNTQMVIVNSGGDIVYKGHVADRIDVALFHAGVYYFKFENGQTEKIIKQ